MSRKLISVTAYTVQFYSKWTDCIKPGDWNWYKSFLFNCRCYHSSVSAIYSYKLCAAGLAVSNTFSPQSTQLFPPQTVNWSAPITTSIASMREARKWLNADNECYSPVFLPQCLTKWASWDPLEAKCNTENQLALTWPIDGLDNTSQGRQRCKIMLFVT